MDSTTRRDFIKQAGALGLAAGLPAITSPADLKPATSKVCYPAAVILESCNESHKPRMLGARAVTTSKAGCAAADYFKFVGGKIQNSILFHDLFVPTADDPIHAFISNHSRSSFIRAELESMKPNQISTYIFFLQSVPSAYMGYNRQAIWSNEGHRLFGGMLSIIKPDKPLHRLAIICSLAEHDEYANDFAPTDTRVRLHILAHSRGQHGDCKPFRFWGQDCPGGRDRLWHGCLSLHVDEDNEDGCGKFLQEYDSQSICWHQDGELVRAMTRCGGRPFCIDTDDDPNNPSGMITRRV